MDILIIDPPNMKIILLIPAYPHLAVLIPFVGLLTSSVM